MLIISFHSTLKRLSGNTQLSIGFKTFPARHTKPHLPNQRRAPGGVPCSVSAEAAESLKELLLGRWAELSPFSCSYKL